MTAKPSTVAERLGDSSGRDPLDELVGAYDVEPGDIDQTVYDR